MSIAQRHPHRFLELLTSGVAFLVAILFLINQTRYMIDAAILVTWVRDGAGRPSVVLLYVMILCGQLGVVLSVLAVGGGWRAALVSMGGIAVAVALPPLATSEPASVERVFLIVGLCGFVAVGVALTIDIFIERVMRPSGFRDALAIVCWTGILFVTLQLISRELSIYRIAAAAISEWENGPATIFIIIYVIFPLLLGALLLISPYRCHFLHRHEHKKETLET